VNEGNPLLMSLLACSENFLSRAWDFTAVDVAVILATFMRDGGEMLQSDETNPFESIRINVEVEKRVAPVLKWIEGERQGCIATEMSYGVFSPHNYWKTSIVWPKIVNMWLTVPDVTISDVAVATGMFEGNVQRGLMRVVNILDEWKAIMTVRNDLDMLETMATVNTKMLRPNSGLVSDSLYLRLA